MIEKIIIYDSKHIEVKFRYQDRFEAALQYIDSFENNKEGQKWTDEEKATALA